MRFRAVATENTPSRNGIRFLRTQAGTLFLNLLLADCLQSIGFGLTWAWVSEGRVISASSACTLQAVGIQAGDVASALFTLAIAIHSVGLLAFSYKPPAIVTNFITIGIWCFVVLMTAIGPSAIQNDTLGSFYGNAGGTWCWITKPYEAERLWLHYFLVSETARSLQSLQA